MQAAWDERGVDQPWMEGAAAGAAACGGGDAAAAGAVCTDCACAGSGPGFDTDGGGAAEPPGVAARRAQGQADQGVAAPRRSRVRASCAVDET